jgi:hypothetical protein
MSTHILFRNNKFAEYCQATIIIRTVLTLDEHDSNCTKRQVLEFSVQSVLRVVCLMQHTAEWLQPSNHVFFKSFEERFFRRI